MLDSLLIPIAALTFAVSSPASVLALRHLSVAEVVAGRCGVAAVILALAAVLRGRRKKTGLGPRERLIAVGAGLALAIHLVLFVAGLAHTSYAAAVALVALEPVGVLAAALVAFGIRPTRPQMVGTALAIAGTLVIGFGGGGPVDTGGLPAHHWSGDLMALGAVAFFGVYYAFSRALADRRGAAGRGGLDLGSAAVIYATAAVLALAVVLAAAVARAPQGGMPAPDLPLEAYLAVVTLGIVPTLIGHTCAQIAARRLVPAVVGLIPPGETLGSLAIGVAFLGARPSVAELAGATLIVLGVLTVTLGTATVSTAYAENLHEGR